MSMLFAGGCAHCLEDPCVCSPEPIEARGAAESAGIAAYEAMTPEEQRAMWGAQIAVDVSDPKGEKGREAARALGKAAAK